MACKDGWTVARRGIHRLKLNQELDLQVWSIGGYRRVNQIDPHANYGVRVFMHTVFIHRDSIEEAKLYALQRAAEALKSGLEKLTTP